MQDDCVVMYVRDCTVYIISYIIQSDVRTRFFFCFVPVFAVTRIFDHRKISPRRTSQHLLCDNIIYYVIMSTTRTSYNIYYNIDDTCFWQDGLIPKPHNSKNFNNSTSVEQRTHSYVYSNMDIRKYVYDYTNVWMYDNIQRNTLYSF